MERRIGPLRAEVIDPESAKFTAPLLLVHGLWSRAAIWRPFTGYLAHRGWLSVAPELRVEASRTDSLDFIAHALAEVISLLPAPPVIVGHDLGALHALGLAHQAIAVVALAPLVLPPLAPVPQGLRKAGSWMDRLRGTHELPAPRRERTSYPPADNAVTEPKTLLDELCERSFDRRKITVPVLVMAGDQDRITSTDAATALATAVGAELQVEPNAGHALLIDKGWDRRVSAVHRWIVRAVGPDLLAMLDESTEE